MPSDFVQQTPLWLQLSLISFLLGVFLIALCLAMFVLDAFPRLYQFLCRLLGDADA